VHTPTDSHVGHLALFINSGTRDEAEDEHGLAHYIEHVLFKGTSKRKAYHILSRLEDVGGEINAYTNKEETCLHASFLTEHFDRALELVSDIVFNSVFPEKELIREKAVIEDEITSYLDSPSDQIFDDFEEMIFANHTIGRSVLGTPESLAGLDRGKVIGFVQKNYVPSNMVLSTTVNLPTSKVNRLLEKHYANSNQSGSSVDRTPFNSYKRFETLQKKEVYQSHVLIGCPAYDVNDKRKMGLAVLSNLLGGPGMNARLSMTLRERNGYSYNVESNYTPYSDTGIFSIYIGCDEKHRAKCNDLTHMELKKLMDQPLGTSQLQKAKQQVMGQLALSAESGLSKVLGNGKTLIALDEVRTYAQIADELNALTSLELQGIANEVFQKDNLSSLTFNNK
jgi:predicted Zn-dependent peptidase